MSKEQAIEELADYFTCFYCGTTFRKKGGVKWD